MVILAKDGDTSSKNQILFKQLKNRYSDLSMNSKFLVNVNKKRMKLEDIEENAQPAMANDGSNKYYEKTAEANTEANPFTFKVKPERRKLEGWNI